MQNFYRTTKHRLPLDAYQGLIRVTYTASLSGRKNLFNAENAPLVEECRQALLDACRRYKCKNLVYVFMPDHIHIVLEGIDDTSNVWKAMVRFKQATGYLFSRKKLGVLWQKNFWDHIHRKEETLDQQIRYVLNNPVRAGIVSEWSQYQFYGSLDYDVESLIGDD